MGLRLLKWYDSARSVQIILATNNDHKVRELLALFAGLPFVWRSLKDYPQVVMPEESGDTFEENAFAKARAVAESTGLWALADDSGLCVDALGGAPGVRSSRYAGDEGNASHNIEKLLAAMKDVPIGKRGASFVCTMALVGPRSETRVVEGRCDGEITFSPRGEGGFGYDPVFMIPKLGKTFAELTEDEKNRVSHRASAAVSMREILSSFPA